DRESAAHPDCARDLDLDRPQSSCDDQEFRPAFRRHGDATHQYRASRAGRVAVSGALRLLDQDGRRGHETRRKPQLEIWASSPSPPPAMSVPVGHIGTLSLISLIWIIP